MKAGHSARTYRTGDIPRPSALDWLHRGARIIGATLLLWRKRRRERRELCGLDDRTLRDIGLTRGHLEFLINKPFWRE